MDDKSDKPEKGCGPKKCGGCGFNCSWVGIIVVLAILLLIIGGYLAFFSQDYTKETKENHIEHKLTALATNDPSINRPATEADLKAAVTAELEALRHNDLQAAYQLTTKEFKAATPMDAFRSFVRNLPILTRYKSLQFENGHMENSQYGKINAILADDAQSMTIEFVVSREDNEWKIFGFRAIFPDANETATPPEADEITALMESQLAALHNKDIGTAYYAFTSKEFQKTTSLEAFRAMVRDFPMLADYTSYRLGSREVDSAHPAASLLIAREGKETRIKYTFIQEDGKWKILTMRATLAYPTPELEFTPAEQEEVVALITRQLQDIKADDVTKAYYAYSSRDLQDAAPLEAFKKFVSTHPFLTQYKSVEFRKGHKEEHLGVMTITLHGEDSDDFVEYLLIPENNGWKIFSMEVQNKPKDDKSSKQAALQYETLEIADASAERSDYEIPPYFNSEDLQIVIENQLKALRNKDFSKAYYGYTSKEFQEITSYKNFEEFVRTHPALTRNTNVAFSKFNIEDEIGTFEGWLALPNDETQGIRARLVFQDGKWKVLSMELEDAGTDTEENGTAQDSNVAFFPQLILGTQIDTGGLVVNGMIAQPGTILPASSKEIYVNVYVGHASSGTEVTIQMEHMNTGSKIPAVSMKIEQDVDSATLAFIFSPPPQGWPKGNYQFHVSSSTGAQRDFPFQLN